MKTGQFYSGSGESYWRGTFAVTGTSGSSQKSGRDVLEKGSIGGQIGLKVRSRDRNMELDELRCEYEELAGLGPKIYSEIQRTVRATIRGHGYPVSYSPTGRWDEDTYDDLTQEFYIQKLHGRGLLIYFLSANETLSGFRKGLELCFRHFLISQRRPSVLHNLFRRLNSVLEKDHRFHCFSNDQKRSKRRWGLATWLGQDRSPLVDGDRKAVQVAMGLSGFNRVVYKPDSKKESPVLSTEQLGDFAFQLLGRVDHLLTVGQMVEALDHRFGPFHTKLSSLDEAISASLERPESVSLHEVIADNHPGIAETILVEEAARQVLNDLTERQKEVVILLEERGATLESVAATLNCSKSTVWNCRRAVWEAIRQASDNPREALCVFNKLIALLMAERNRQDDHLSGNQLC